MCTSQHDCFFHVYQRCIGARLMEKKNTKINQMKYFLFRLLYIRLGLTFWMDHSTLSFWNSFSSSSDINNFWFFRILSKIQDLPSSVSFHSWKFVFFFLKQCLIAHIQITPINLNTFMENSTCRTWPFFVYQSMLCILWLKILAEKFEWIYYLLIFSTFHRNFCWN